MPVLSGAYAARRFRVTGNPDAASPTTAAAALEANAFPFDWKGAGTKAGWVSVDNLLDAQFVGPRDWVVGNYYVFTMRFDNRQVAPSLLKAHLDKACDAWLKEHGRTRIPREVKRELKENISTELVQKMNPRTRTYDVCWDLTTNIVSFSGLTDTLVDQFRMLFQRTFDCTIEPVHPMGDEVKTSEVSDFYLWLWWALENGGDLEVEDSTIDGRITLADTTATTTIAAEVLQQVPEARLAALNGKRPTSVKMSVTFNELQFAFTLQGSDIDLVGLKIPDGSGDAKGQRFDREASILDRMALYEAVQDKVHIWVKKYETLKATNWDAWLESDCNPWLKGII
jgi:hypothetical protein